jgi:hypothetical protein
MYKIYDFKPLLGGYTLFVLVLPNNRVLPLDMEDVAKLKENSSKIWKWASDKSVSYRNLPEFICVNPYQKLTLVAETESINDVLPIMQTLQLVGVTDV